LVELDRKLWRSATAGPVIRHDCAHSGATYRLQFNAGFTFRAARTIVGYHTH
jgi:hypothetical protein